jgi:uncharacterized protein (TIGR03643 family)
LKWRAEDRTPFEAIEHQFGSKENDIREITHRELKPFSFKSDIKDLVKKNKTFGFKSNG